MTEATSAWICGSVLGGAADSGPCDTRPGPLIRTMALTMPTIATGLGSLAAAACSVGTQNPASTASAGTTARK